MMGDLTGSKNTDNSLIDGKIDTTLSWKVV